MGSREDGVDVDDDFSDIYKAYTGPVVSNAPIEPEKTNKRSHAGSDEEEQARDPNAVPTDFTSREAKVWEAKSKATERNWKKRKEEEMICKICGESGHFTQVLLCNTISLLHLCLCLRLRIERNRGDILLAPSVLVPILMYCILYLVIYETLQFTS